MFMRKLGYIEISQKNQTNMFLARWKKCKSKVESIIDIPIVRIEIPFLIPKHINKALDLCDDYKIHNIIIQDYIKKYMENNKIRISNKIIDGKILKKVALSIAVTKFLKKECKDIEKSNVLIISDTIGTSNYEDFFIDTLELCINLAKKCKNILVVSENNLNYIENYIIDSTGLCPIVSNNINLIIGQNPDIIINLSNRVIDYSNLKKVFIFDSSIKDYHVTIPKAYNNYSIKSEEYNYFAEGIFKSINSQIDLNKILKTKEKFQIKYVIQLLKEEGFNVSL